MYLGYYMGAPSADETTVVVVSGSAATTSPVASPYSPTAPEYVDVAETAVDRLCEFAKEKAI